MLLCGAMGLIFHYTYIRSEEKLQKIWKNYVLFQIIDTNEELNKEIKDVLSKHDRTIDSGNIKEVMSIITKGLEGRKLNDNSKSKLKDLGFEEEQIDRIEAIAVKLIGIEFRGEFDPSEPINKANEILMLVLSGLIITIGIIFIFNYKKNRYV